MLKLEEEISVLQRIVEAWRERDRKLALALRYALESHLGKQLKPVTAKDEESIALLNDLEEGIK